MKTPANNSSIAAPVLESTTSCRLCSGQANHVFTKCIMHKYNVNYFVCGSCGSLETQEPTWLDEAYRNPIRYTDTSGGHRAMQMPIFVYYLARVFGLKCDSIVLDWGGGDGLITRRMRDLGLDARSYDMYDTCRYAAGFEGAKEDNPIMITAFEVLEHMAQPGQELGALMRLGAKVIFATTCLYHGQGSDWGYLAPYSGRHVFFYSAAGLIAFAAGHGYKVLFFGDRIVFYSLELRGVQKNVLQLLFSPLGSRLATAALVLVPPRGRIHSDWVMMRNRVGDT